MIDSSQLDTVLQNAIAGRAVLFLGAGASRDGHSKVADSLPSGDGLVQILCDELGITNKRYSLPAIAQHYRKTRGAHALLSILQDRLTVTYVPPDLIELLQLPWTRIYTTNYDNLVEMARPKSKSFAIGDDTRGITNGSIVHLNGYVNQVNIHRLDNDLVLTDWSYAQSEFFGSRWMTTFTSDIYGASSVLFAGYSMRDLDISRALIRETGIAARSAIVVGPDDDPIESSSLEYYGTVYRTGLKYVYARLKQNRKVVTSEAPPLIDSFHYLGGPSTVSTTFDRSDILFDQFVYGRLSETRLLSAQPAEQAVVVDRKDVGDALASAIADGVADIVVHGNLGAGKTVATLQMARTLIERGYIVLRALNRRSSISELDAIVRFHKDRKIAIIFENYQRYTEEIEHFSSIRRSGDISILTARSPIHELYEAFVERVTRKIFRQVAVDRLSFDEIVRLDELLNYAGLWKEHAGRSPGARIKLAQETFGSSMARILLDVVRSTDIRDRVTDVIDEILEDKSAAKLFVAALIINSLQYEFWIRDWQNLFAVTDLQGILKRHKDALSNFINLSSSHWSSNSSLLSGEILREVIGNAQIVDTLVDIYRAADNNRFQDHELDRLRIDLMRYNQIEGLFNSHDKPEGLREYYRRIRQVGQTADNADYWLQYGIVLSIHANLFDPRDLEEAELAFQNAYGREGAKRQPNTIRIDNYYSRFQMQKAVVAKDHAVAGTIFLDASQKLIRQVFDEEARHYPFKVGRLYTDIAASHYDHWDAALRDRFISRCQEMVRYAEARLAEHEHKDVRLLRNDLKKVLKQLVGED